MTKYRKYEDSLTESLKDSREAEAYLNANIEAFMEDNDIESLMFAFEHLIKASYSVSKLARKIGISRMHLYRIFNNETTPSFTIIMEIIKSLGFKIEAKRNLKTA